MQFLRVLRHLFATDWATRRRFDAEVLGAIETAIRDVESRHSGEIRVAIETAFDLPELWQGLGTRQRALQVFGFLGVWDTAANNGVLIYMLNADRAVEIVADRGIAARVLPAEWDAVCRNMEDHFRAGRFREGSVAGVLAVGKLLQQHFPDARSDRNELPDQAVLL
jgi:uncharacterized membrane protein